MYVVDSVCGSFAVSCSSTSLSLNVNLTSLC